MKQLLTTLVMSLLSLSFFSACTANQSGSEFRALQEAVILIGDLVSPRPKSASAIDA